MPASKNFFCNAVGWNATAAELGEIVPGARDHTKCYPWTPMAGLSAADKDDAENAARRSAAICFTVASIEADLIRRRHAR
jgi:hypothetical protein